MVKKNRDVKYAVALALFIFFSIAYFSSTSGIYSSNDGSHYALVRSIADNGTFTVNSFVMFTGFTDYAKVGDDYYSDRAPGTALAVLPFYLFGKVFSSILPLAAYHRGFDPGNPSALAALLLSNLAGAATVAITYLSCRKFGVGDYAALCASLVVGFGTLVWKYSINLFSHSFSCAIFMSAFYIAIGLEDIRKQRKETAALFFLLGYLPIIEYPNVLLSGVIFAYLMFKKAITKDVISDVKVMQTLILAAICPVFLAVYNTVNFGSPITNAYKFSPHHAWVGSLSDSLTTPMWEGMVGLMISGELVGHLHSAQGSILILTPAFILGLFSIPSMYRKARSETLFIIALFMAHLMFYAMFKWWWGGGSSDTRYVLTITPLLALPLSFWVENNIQKSHTDIKRFLYQALMWLLIVISMINVAEDVSTFEGTARRDFILPAIYPSQIGITFASVLPNA